MQAGQLRDEIEVSRRVTTRNQYGERQDFWTSQFTTRAQKIVQNARRTMSSGEVWYPRAAVFRIRLGFAVTEGDRILCGGELYDVVSVTEDRMREMCMTINCELHNE